VPSVRAPAQFSKRADTHRSVADWVTAPRLKPVTGARPPGARYRDYDRECIRKGHPSKWLCGGRNNAPRPRSNVSERVGCDESRERQRIAEFVGRYRKESRCVTCRAIARTFYERLLGQCMRGIDRRLKGSGHGSTKREFWGRKRCSGTAHSMDETLGCLAAQAHGGALSSSARRPVAGTLARLHLVGGDIQIETEAPLANGSFRIGELRFVTSLHTSSRKISLLASLVVIRDVSRIGQAFARGGVGHRAFRLLLRGELFCSRVEVRFCLNTRSQQDLTAPRSLIAPWDRQSAFFYLDVPCTGPALEQACKLYAPCRRHFDGPQAPTDFRAYCERSRRGAETAAMREGPERAMASSG